MTKAHEVDQEGAQTSVADRLQECLKKDGPRHKIISRKRGSDEESDFGNDA